MRKLTPSFFAKHMVCLGWIDATPGVRAAANNGIGEFQNATCFVVSVDDIWFLFTAGHVLKEIEAAQLNGQILKGWHLDDSAGLNARYVGHEGLIPFDFEGAQQFCYFSATNENDVGDSSVNNDDPESILGIDYGFIHLRPHYRTLLEKNGIEALNEMAWQRNVPDECDSYWMLGVPNDFIVQNADTIEKGHAFIQIQRLVTPPAGSEMEFEPYLFYGQIDISDETGDSHMSLNDIRGMSGAPIFGFKKLSTGELKYWIVAIQSSWRKSEGIIIASPVKVFAEWISQVELPRDIFAT